MKYLVSFIFAFLLSFTLFGQLNQVGFCGGNAEFSIKYLGNNRMVSSRFNTLEFYDISIPSLPNLYASVNAPGFYPLLCICRAGNYIYIQSAQGSSGVSVFSIIDYSNPNSPTLIGSCNWGNYTGYSIGYYNNKAYVLGNDSLFIYDVSNPSIPVFIGKNDVYGNPAEGIVIKNSNIYVGTDQGLNVFNILNSGLLNYNSVNTSIITSGSIATDNLLETLFSTNYSAGKITVYDFTNTSNITIKYQISSGIGHCVSQTNYLYGLGDSLHVYRIYPTTYTHIASKANSFNGSSIDAQDSSFVYVAANMNNLIFTFNANATTGISKFNSDQKDNYEWYFNGNTIKIYSGSKLAYELVDVFSTKIIERGELKPGENTQIYNLNTGVYILRVLNEETNCVKQIKVVTVTK